VGRGEAAYVTADLETVDGPGAAVRATLDRFGQLDILVNNGAPTVAGGLAAWSAATVPDGLAGKAVAYVRAALVAAPAMPPGGVIVNVGGMSGRSAVPSYLLGMMAVGAITAMTKSLADELGPSGIRVVGVDPGLVATPRLLETAVSHLMQVQSKSREEVLAALEAPVPLQRLGAPEDIAAVIVFLASGRASYVTGTTVAVDGGLSRSVS
jgi:NAD(P)-dependent dehydrogenase (short-subunit alcohol dehydrogenase family)